MEIKDIMEALDKSDSKGDALVKVNNSDSAAVPSPWLRDTLSAVEHKPSSQGSTSLNGSIPTMDSLRAAPATLHPIFTPLRMPVTPWIHDAMPLPTPSDTEEYKPYSSRYVTAFHNAMNITLLSETRTEQWPGSNKVLESITGKFYDPAYSTHGSCGDLSHSISTEPKKTSIKKALEHPELFMETLDFTKTQRECLHALECQRRIWSALEEKRDALAHLMLSITLWSSEHCLGLLELLDAMEDNGESLAQEFYGRMERVTSTGDYLIIHGLQEHLSLELPRQLLQIAPPSTVTATAARIWIQHTQGIKRLRPLVGIPKMIHGHVFTYGAPYLNPGVRNANGEKAMFQFMKRRFVQYLDYYQEQRWERFGDNSPLGRIIHFINQSELEVRTKVDFISAMKGLFLARNSDLHDIPMLIHPEWYNYSSFLALGKLMEEYNGEWALSAWEPEAESESNFNGFAFINSGGDDEAKKCSFEEKIVVDQPVPRAMAQFLQGMPTLKGTPM